MSTPRSARGIIDAYLSALQRFRSEDNASIEQLHDDVNRLQAQILNTDSPTTKLALIAARRRTEAMLQSMVSEKELAKLEDRFVEVAEQWGEANKVDAETWLEVGVPLEVLARAGIRSDHVVLPKSRPRSTGRGRSATRTKVTGTRNDEGQYHLTVTFDRTHTRRGIAAGLGSTHADASKAMLLWGLDHWHHLDDVEAYKLTQPPKTARRPYVNRFTIEPPVMQKIRELEGLLGPYPEELHNLRSTEARVKRLALAICLQDHPSLAL